MSGTRIKTYVVLQRMNVPTAGGDNLRLLDVFLTRAKAQSVVDARPGTFWEKRVASK